MEKDSHERIDSGEESEKRYSKRMDGGKESEMEFYHEASCCDGNEDLRSHKKIDGGEESEEMKFHHEVFAMGMEIYGMNRG